MHGVTAGTLARRGRDCAFGAWPRGGDSEGGEDGAPLSNLRDRVAEVFENSRFLNTDRSET